MPGCLSFLTEQLLDVLGSSPQWTCLFKPLLWGGGDLAGAPGGRAPVCSSSAFPHLHACSCSSRSACPFRCRPKGCSSQAFALHLLRQFSSPKIVQPQQHQQPQTADLLSVRHMLGPECRPHSNWDPFSCTPRGA